MTGSEKSSAAISSHARLRLMWGRDVIYVFEFLDEILELLRGWIGLQKLLHDFERLMVVAFAGCVVCRRFCAFGGFTQGDDLFDTTFGELVIVNGVLVVFVECNGVLESLDRRFPLVLHGIEVFFVLTLV